MHIVSWVPGAAPQPIAEVSHVVYGIVREMGGSVSAEHGIGTLKKPYLGHSRSDAELALMRRLKACLGCSTRPRLSTEGKPTAKRRRR